MERRIAGVLIAVAVLAGTPVGGTQGSFSGGSPICGAISGSTQRDLENALSFCDTMPEGTANGAYAAGSSLVVKVVRTAADRIRGDQTSAEPLVLEWLATWKQLSGSQPVTLTVRWGDIRIARAATTPSGDQVTFP